MYRLSAMRIVRAGERPSADAAAMRLVVLNGTGGCRVRALLLDGGHLRTCRPLDGAIAAFACASSLKRAVACGASKASAPSPAVGPVFSAASKAPLITQ